METTGRRVGQLVLVIGMLASMPMTEAAARRLECAGSFRRSPLTRAVDGAWTITCPSGRVETHAAADVAEGGCGPIAACALGPCPVGHPLAE